MFYSKSTNGFYYPAIHENGIPEDAVEISDELHADLLAGQSQGKLIVPGADGQPTLQDPPTPTTEQVLANLVSAVQKHVDAAAQAWGYDDARSAVSYIGDPFPRFDAEGRAIRDFRSACWVIAGKMREQVLAGVREIPTDAELLAELPAAPNRPVEGNV